MASSHQPSMPPAYERSLRHAWRFAQRVGTGARVEGGTGEPLRVVAEFANGNEMDIYPSATADLGHQPEADGA